jgi:hypothetical protein
MFHHWIAVILLSTLSFRANHCIQWWQRKIRKSHWKYIWVMRIVIECVIVYIAISPNWTWWLHDPCLLYPLLYSLSNLFNISIHGTDSFQKLSIQFLKKTLEQVVLIIWTPWKINSQYFNYDYKTQVVHCTLHHTYVMRIKFVVVIVLRFQRYQFLFPRG